MSTSTPQRDKKLQALNTANAQLEKDLETLKETHADAVKKLVNPERKGEDTVKRHIKLLHDYNEVRDVAVGLMGLVAENRGVPVATIMAENGVGEAE